MRRVLRLLTLTTFFSVGALAADTQMRTRRPPLTSGDTVTISLRQGSDISGTYRGNKGGQIRLEISGGGEIYIEPSTVEKIRKISVNDAEYLSRKASIDENDAAAHWSLCQWARNKDMRAAALAEAQIVVDIMPEHKAAAIFLENPQWPTQPMGNPNQTKSLPEKNAWRVSGTVYSIVTLKPEPGAVITFRRNPRESTTVTTDKNGAYEIDLPKKGVWTVSMEVGYFRRGQLLDADPSYLVRDAAERRFVVEHTTGDDLAPVQIDWKPTDTKVRLDLFAVSEGWLTVHP